MKPVGSTRLLAVTSFAFLLTGMAAASFGPLLPDLAHQTGSSTVAAGSTLVALPAGGLSGQIFAGLLSNRFGKRVMLAVGMCVFLFGILGVICSVHLWFLLGSVLCLGFGCGSMILAGNVLAAEASEGAGPLNLVNAMFGLGAIASPALIALSLAMTGSGMLALWVIPCAALAGLALLLFWLPKPAFASGQSSGQHSVARHSLGAAFKLPLLWLIGILVFLYVATEASIGGWLSTILHKGADVPVAVGAVITSWFWLVHTASRFGAAWISKYVSPQAMLRGSIALCILGSAALAACAALHSSWLGIVAAAVLGLGVGPIMPASLAMTRSSLPLDVSLATAIVLAFGTIGGISVPWGLGVLMFASGAFTGTLVLLTMPLVMAGLLFIMAQNSSSLTPLKQSIAP